MKNEQNKFITNDCNRSFSEASEKLEKLKGKTLLITGGTGFMGSWICEMVYYMNKVHKMDISLILMARNKARFERNLPHIKNSKKIKFIYSDVLKNIEIPKKVNYIIHAAANPDNRFHASRPFESMITVAEGASNLFQSASQLPSLHNILNVSSSSVYCTHLKKGEKFSEDLSDSLCSNKVSDYFSAANRYSESLCNAARSEFRLPISTIRPFTFCGAYQDIDSPWAINNFINDALHKRPIKIHGDGEVIRSYMYGADLAIWTLVIMLHTKNGEVYNVGSTHGSPLKEIANKVASYFPPISSIMTNTSLVANNHHSILLPDTAKAERDFGLKLYTSIDTSIKRSAQWFKDNLNYE